MPNPDAYDGVAGGNRLLGTAEADAFYSWFGDANGDRAVDNAESTLFQTAYGKKKNSGPAGYNSAFDYNQDGSIDFTDYYSSSSGKLPSEANRPGNRVYQNFCLPA